MSLKAIPQLWRKNNADGELLVSNFVLKFVFGRYGPLDLAPSVLKEREEH